MRPIPFPGGQSGQKLYISGLLGVELGEVLDHFHWRPTSRAPMAKATNF
jgi:hypothetical protein